GPLAPAVRLGMTRFLLDLGYHVEAAEYLEALIRDWPQDEDAAEQYGTAIERVYEAAEEDEEGRSVRGENGERGAAVLSRFADRSALLALYDALGKYLAATDHGAHLLATVEVHRRAVLDMGWPEGKAQGFGEFAEELALLGTADNDDPAANPMAAFAADP